MSSSMKRYHNHLKQQYIELAKSIQKDNWMYPPVDDILQGKTWTNKTRQSVSALLSTQQKSKCL